MRGMQGKTSDIRADTGKVSRSPSGKASGKCSKEKQNPKWKCQNPKVEITQVYLKNRKEASGAGHQ